MTVSIFPARPHFGWLLALAVLVSVLLAVACDGSGDASGGAQTPTLTFPDDPAAQGPYAVGRTNLRFERASSTTGEPRVLETVLWYPAAGEARPLPVDDAAPAAGGPFPVVIFSHGHSGSPLNASYLTEHLASWGFVVAAPPHPGNTADDCNGVCGFDTIPDSAANRVDDVTFVLDELLALRADGASRLGPIIDADRAALIGHSFGGWTAVAGAPGGRFDAIVSVAPGLPQTLLGRAAETHAPVLLIAGGADELIPQAGVEELYRALPPETPRALVVLPAARHTSFIDVCVICPEDLPQERAHELVRRYTTAFLLEHAAGDSRFAAVATSSDPPDAVSVP